MDAEIIKGIISLVLGLGYIVLVPYFLYTILWWFPFLFIGGLISGENFKKDNLDFLSPFIIVQMTFPKNRSAQIPIGLAIVILSAVGAYIFLNDDSVLLAVCAMFVGVMTFFGIALSLRSEYGK